MEYGERLAAFRRGKLLTAVNRGGETAVLPAGGELLLAVGKASLEGDALTLSPDSGVILLTD